jgi:hypothetical protein
MMFSWNEPGFLFLLTVKFSEIETWKGAGHQKASICLLLANARKSVRFATDGSGSSERFVY